MIILVGSRAGDLLLKGKNPNRNFRVTTHPREYNSTLISITSFVPIKSAMLTSLALNLSLVTFRLEPTVAAYLSCGLMFLGTLILKSHIIKTAMLEALVKKHSPLASCRTPHSAANLQKIQIPLFLLVA